MLARDTHAALNHSDIMISPHSHHGNKPGVYITWVVTTNYTVEARDKYRVAEIIEMECLNDSLVLD